MPRLDTKEIRDALVPTHILDHFEIEYREARDELYTRSCPTCGERSRESMCINATTGLWKCQRCSAHGDILALVAGYAQFDAKTQFSRILEVASVIANLGDGSVPIDRTLLEERKRQKIQQAVLQKQRTAAARAKMPAEWKALALRDARGESYLQDRSLDPKALRAIVRYTKDGDPALPLRDLTTGDIVGIQQRNLDPLKPKLLCARGSQLAGTALHGKMADLDPDGVDVAVVVEGLADTLAAILSFEGCAIFGAPGAAQLPAVVAAVAQRVAVCRGWLLLVVDGDDVGEKGAVDAILAAQETGLTLAPANAGLAGSSTIRLVRLGKNLAGTYHHDLADARSRSRWRWERPTA